MKKIFAVVLGFFAKMLGKKSADSVKSASAVGFGDEFFSEKGKLEWKVEVLERFVVTNLRKEPVYLDPGQYTLSLIGEVPKKSVAMLKVVNASLFAPIPYWQSNVLKENVRIIK